MQIQLKKQMNHCQPFDLEIYNLKSLRIYIYQILSVDVGTKKPSADNTFTKKIQNKNLSKT